MLQRLQRAVDGLDGTVTGANRAFDIVRNCENPWKDAKEPLAKCILLLCADELDKPVPNASSCIVEKMHVSYDRVRAHHVMTTQLFGNIEPALAAGDYNHLVHALAAWDARRIAASLAAGQEEHRTLQHFGVAEVLEHPRYLVDDNVSIHARNVMADRENVPHICKLLGKLVPGMLQLLSSEDEVLVEFAKACVEHCASSDDYTRDIDSAVLDVVDELLQAVEADRFADDDSRRTTWQQLSFVLEHLGRHLMQEILQRYPGFPLLLMLGASDDAAQADTPLWSTTVYCLEVAVTYGGAQFWAASELLPDAVMDALLPCLDASDATVRSIAVGAASTIVCASENTLRTADVALARSALLDHLCDNMFRSEPLLAQQAICQLLQNSLAHARLSDWLARCQEQWLPVFLWRPEAPEDRARFAELPNEVALTLVSELAKFLRSCAARCQQSGAPAAVSWLQAQSLLTQLTDATPTIINSEDVMQALLAEDAHSCVFSTDPDDATKSQLDNFQRGISAQHEAVAQMLRRVVEILPQANWDVLQFWHTGITASGTLLCCGADAVAEATAELLLALCSMLGMSAAASAPLTFRSKLQAVLEAAKTDADLLSSLLHSFSDTLAHLFKPDAAPAYHLLIRCTRVTKIVWENIAEADATNEPAAAFAERSWRLFCAVVSDNFKAHPRFTETIQNALQLGRTCWPTWLQTINLERLRNGILQQARYLCVINALAVSPNPSIAAVVVQMCDVLSALPNSRGSRAFSRLYQALLEHSQLIDRPTLDRLAQAEADISKTLFSSSTDTAFSDPLQDLEPLIDVSNEPPLVIPLPAVREQATPIALRLKYPAAGTTAKHATPVSKGRDTPWVRRRQPHLQWINGKQVLSTAQAQMRLFQPAGPRTTSKLDKIKAENAMFDPGFSVFGENHAYYDVDAEWEREEQLRRENSKQPVTQHNEPQTKPAAVDLSKFLGVAPAAAASSSTFSATSTTTAPLKSLVPIKATVTTGNRALDMQLKQAAVRRSDFNPTLFIFQELNAVQLRDFQRTVLSWPLQSILQGPLPGLPSSGLPDRYLHDQQYVKSFEGLFYEELRCAIVQELQATLRSDTSSQQIEVVSQGVLNHASDGMCTLEFRYANEDNAESAFPRNGRLSLPSHGNHLVLLYDQMCSSEDFSPEHQMLALLQGDSTNKAQPTPSSAIKLHAMSGTGNGVVSPLLDRLCSGVDATCHCLVIQNLSTALREYAALHSVGSLRLAPYILKATPTISVASLQRLQHELESKLKAEDMRGALELLNELGAMNVDIVVLQQTGIVELINLLRKHEHEDIRQQALVIRQTWKSQIKQDHAARSYKGGVLANTSGSPSRPSGVPPKLWQQLCRRYNSSQLWAIHYACSFRSRYFDTDISLLQGPPGTGKTKTILGITSALLAQVHKDVAAAGSRNYRLMICAPSNAAVDELVIRLRKDGLLKPDGNAFIPRIIRLGQVLNDCSPEVVECSLDFQLDQKLQEEGAAQRLAQVQQQLRDISSKMRQASSGKDRRELLLQKKELYRQRSQLTQQVDRSRSRLKNELILGADIVLCTLSAAGSAVVEDLVGLHRVLFDAVIVDEAAQACELTTLIPLRYGCRKLILVGDPRQLPATVLSNEAQALGYATSLFERLERVGHEIVMLKVQYRMHPSIRVFPSQRFYQSALSDAPFITRAFAAWQAQPEHPPKDEVGLCWSFHRDRCFAPFVFYDVAGRESRSGSSVHNEHEADFILALLHGLVKTAGVALATQCSIAVITPYRAQLRLIKGRLASSSLAVRDNVEVNTVDGFQGREKDIVIISCVRSSGSGAIGFLRDARRMNVAITRARSCLWVCGNAHALAHDEDWRALVENARERHSFVRTRASESFQDLQARVAATTPEQDSRNLPALPTMVKRKADDAFGKRRLAPEQSKQKRPYSDVASATRPPVPQQQTAPTQPLEVRPQVQTPTVMTPSSSVDAAGRIPKKRRH